ncbi:MAG: methyltransferase domain-containing protein [Chloroflexi bacterium]|nr:methyltransferase domain-containing protein [Chloroflexota bacterium]
MGNEVVHEELSRRAAISTHARSRSLYDALSPWYDLLTAGQENALRAAALKALALQPGEHVLEVGFGTGTALAAMIAAVGETGRVWGLDLSLGMARVARRRLRNTRRMSCVGLACGDALRLPLRAASMDALFLSFTLELLEAAEIPIALGECRRVLCRGGRMGLVCLSSEAGSPAVNNLYTWAHVRWPRVLDCHPIRPREWLAACGFSILTRRPMSLWGLGVEILVCRSARVQP